jgi:hypothetical protein
MSEIRDALVLWCESPNNPKTRRIPERIDAYLKQDKPVYYAPSFLNRYPENYPIGNMELVLSGEEGMQDSYVQQRLLIEKLKLRQISDVEICGPLLDFCLSWLKDDLEKAGVHAVVNTSYSTLMCEHLI